METITLKKCEDGAIWVTSDENVIGTETTVERIKDEKQQFIVALADFLEYEPLESMRKRSEQISISLITTLEDILENSGAEWEIAYLPDSGTYVLKLNDEIVHLI